jgi:hypothetical protein
MEQSSVETLAIPWGFTYGLGSEIFVLVLICTTYVLCSREERWRERVNIPTQDEAVLKKYK